MSHGQICPKCGSYSVGYKRPIGNPFGKGVWKCYKCGHTGEYTEFRDNKPKETKKRPKKGK